MSATDDGLVDPLRLIDSSGDPQDQPERSYSLRVLGTMEMRSGDVVAELGPPKQRALLAVLVLNANEVVATDRLIDLLWGDRAPRTAAHSIQIYISELRKSFAPFVPPPVIATRQPGYRLEIRPGAVDALQFESLVRTGTRAVQSGHRRAGITDLRSAIDLWRGGALADFAYEDFAQPHIIRLHERRLDALEELAAAELADGQVQAAMQRAEAVVRESPLRERGQDLLMRALYQSGRHVEALRSYQCHRQLLAEELGVVPSPPLQQLNERILLHDPSLLPVAPVIPSIGAPARNPYKGLRPFREEDAEDFFGRDDLVDQMVALLRDGKRLVALVGPSGSGKSSVVAAKLIPELRGGAVPGSERWLIVSVVPGSHPMQQVEALIAREATVGTRTGPLVDGGDQVVQPSFRIAPEHSHVLLFIDQFEELFVAAEEPSRRRFLDALTTAVTEPDSHLTVVLTLRADHYDRPLLYPDFADAFSAAVLNVLPMTAQELEAAVIRPAAQVGVGVQPALLAELIADTADQPGSLPLLQYALTAQFEAAGGADLTLDDYRDMGGLRAILTRRAEDLYLALSEEEQHATLQTLLRMVRLGQGTGDVRRRVLISELTDLDLDPAALSGALEQFCRNRLFSFDRDPTSGASTVEVAHEALLGEWPRLAGWIERHRAAVRRLESIRTAAEEWEFSGRHPDYLLTGSRLAEVGSWTRSSVFALSTRERAFIGAGVEREQATQDAESSRARAQHRLERRSRLRLVALAAAIALLAGAVAYGMLTPGDAQPGEVALFYNGGGVVANLIETGFDRGVTEFGLVRHEYDAADTGDIELDALSAGDLDLIIVWAVQTDVDAAALAHPGTQYVLLDGTSELSNVSSIQFDVNEGSFLAGAAAALTSATGTIGFIGGVDFEQIWRFQAGYEAGARAVDPDIEILATYLSEPPRYGDGFENPTAGADAARQLYRSGADVIFAAAGTSGLGVFQAAVEMSESIGSHLWAIGVDSDQYFTVVDLLGSVGAEAWSEHVLTSMVKRYDTALFTVLGELADGGFSPGPHEFNLANGGVDLSYSGGFIDGIRPQIEELRARIIAGEIRIPCRPVDRAALGGPSESSTCD